MIDTFYDRISAPFERDAQARKYIRQINRGSARLFLLIYPLMLAYLLIRADRRLFKVFLVPALGFLGVSLLRRYVDAPRPYERQNLRPLIPKDTKGLSFPSRHVFSACIIAMAVGYVWKIPGIALGIAAALIAMIRVIARVHFLSDVVCAALLAAVPGIIAFGSSPYKSKR